MQNEVPTQPKSAPGVAVKSFFTRKQLYSVHSWIGVIVGLLILLISLTGTVTVFKAELDWALTPALRVAPAASRVSLDQVIGGVASAYPDYDVRQVELQNGARWAHIVKVEKRGGASDSLKGQAAAANGKVGAAKAQDRSAREAEVFVNPYSGQVTGERRGASPAEVVKRFHTNLWLNFQSSELGLIGRMIVAATGFVLAVLSLTGFWLYRNKLKTLFTIRVREGRRVLFTDLHKVVGIWTIAFNLMIGITAVTFGVKDSAKFFRSEAGQGGRGKSEARTGASKVAAPRPDFEKALAAASAAVPGMRIKTLQTGKQGEVRVIGKVSGAIIPEQSVMVEAPAGTNSALKIRDARSEPASQRVSSFLKPLHFAKWGEGGSAWAEYLVKGLWSFLGLAPGLLSISGFAMYWMRKRKAFLARAGNPCSAGELFSEEVACASST